MIPKPTHRAVVDVGHKCNVNCLHCYHKHEAEKGYKPKTELIQRILKAKDRGNTYIDFTGGEPTLHPDIVELVNLCTENNLKCCIITNGMTGAKKQKELIDAGVDDWLISTHGIGKNQNEITQNEKSRELQKKFINTLTKYKKNFRFNCCLLAYNQYDLIDFAKWATTFEYLTMVNFINFNPHSKWANKIEEIRKNMADLSIVGEQINGAIAVLRESKKLINVRYFPMCIIEPEYRMHVCNDLQVLFDPYEWDYDIFPKNYNNYLNSSLNMSSSFEHKGQPCIACKLIGVCGGINTNFYNASENKKIISAVQEGDPIYDIYHYRRLNTGCLKDPAKRNKFCIVAIADENVKWHIPLFIYSSMKNIPDIEIKVIARFNQHEQIRKIVESFGGKGFYDSVVVERLMEEYPSEGRTTAALRFVEFEDLLGKYESLLFTDIDIIFEANTEIEQYHRNKMEKDGTICYENSTTRYEGERISGVHFITREWWDTTRGQRLIEADRLKKDPNPTRHNDEWALRRMVLESGLPLSPIEHRPERHHGVHLGDWKAAKNLSNMGEIPDRSTKLLKRVCCDPIFRNIVKLVSDESEEIRKISYIWKNAYEPKNNYIENPEEIENKIPTPAPVMFSNRKHRLKKREKVPFDHYDNKICFFAMCNKAYEWYAPLFVYSALKYAKTKNDMHIVIGFMHDPDKEVVDYMFNGRKPDLIDTKKGNIFGTEDITIVKNINDLSGMNAREAGWTTASYRFVSSFGVLDKFDYTLITDIDIMHMEEERSVIDTHMRNLKIDKTECFENWISNPSTGRMPGVHFVTKDWWDNTKIQRKIELDLLKKNGAKTYWYDEVMLGRIVSCSNLTLPPTMAKMWRNHGAHIGDWRLNMSRKIVVRPNVWICMHIEKLIKDNVYLSIWEKASEKILFLNDVMKCWKRLIK